MKLDDGFGEIFDPFGYVPVGFCDSSQSSATYKVYQTDSSDIKFMSFNVASIFFSYFFPFLFHSSFQTAFGISSRFLRPLHVIMLFLTRPPRLL